MNPLWMIIGSLVAVALLAVGFTIQHRFARRRAAIRPLPPLGTTGQQAARAASRELLSRDALINPNRSRNVPAWDDTPDTDGIFAPAAETRVDGDFLANRGPSSGER
ncbi:hypothetical protein [Micropruina sp.]|uniref:hypothetical protein n=1 Tax=Micropruina sp. TaxID=2737536 RepID=UPI0039E50AC9